MGSPMSLVIYRRNRLVSTLMRRMTLGNIPYQLLLKTQIFESSLQPDVEQNLNPKSRNYWSKDLGVSGIEYSAATKSLLLYAQ